MFPKSGVTKLNWPAGAAELGCHHKHSHTASVSWLLLARLPEQGTLRVDMPLRLQMVVPALI